MLTSRMSHWLQYLVQYGARRLRLCSYIWLVSLHARLPRSSEEIRSLTNGSTAPSLAVRARPSLWPRPSCTHIRDERPKSCLPRLSTNSRCLHPWSRLLAKLRCSGRDSLLRWFLQLPGPSSRRWYNVDLWQPVHRAVATSAFLLATFLGPALGPALGGFAAQDKGWRWTQWLLLFLMVPTYLYSLGMKETYKKIILQNRAKNLGYRHHQRGLLGWQKSSS